MRLGLDDTRDLTPPGVPEVDMQEPDQHGPDRKIRSSLGVPELIDDAIPSSTAQKMMKLVSTQMASSAVTPREYMHVIV